MKDAVCVARSFRMVVEFDPIFDISDIDIANVSPEACAPIVMYVVIEYEQSLTKGEFRAARLETRFKADFFFVVAGNLILFDDTRLFY